MNPGIVDHWRGSTHAATGVGCVECHQSAAGELDSFSHHAALIATVVTPRDCTRCHPSEAEEFAESHHAVGGNILASLDNSWPRRSSGPAPLRPHTPTPGRATAPVNGLASAFSGCQQCHGSKVGLRSTDGGVITVDDLRPDDQAIPTNAAVASIAHGGRWPAGARSRHVAEHGDRPVDPGRLARVLRTTTNDGRCAGRWRASCAEPTSHGQGRHVEL